MRRWCGAVICALSIFFVLPVVRVAAHASFIGSNPVDGSVLAEAPMVAELRFSEPVLNTASKVQLLHLGTNQQDDLSLSTAHGGTTLLAEMPQLERGAYILRYVAVDPADLHKTVGSISFGIGVAAPPSESGSQIDSSWLSIALKVITDGALLLGVGAVVVAVLLVRNGRRDLGHVTRLAVISSAVIAVGWAGLLAADAAAVGFGNVQWGSLILTSDPGRRALVGVQLAVGLWWTVRLLHRGGNHAAQWFVVRILAGIAGGFVLASAYGGHAGIGGSFLVGVALRALHLAALSVWIGAVAAVWLLGRRDRQLRALWPSISWLAAIGLAVTGATGLLLSGRVAVTVTALLGTTYGQRIVIKAGLLVVLAVLGAMATRRIRRGGEPRRLPLELGVAALAIVIAGLLASSAPARGEQFLPPPHEEPQIATSDVLDLTISASIEPARPGPNLVQVRVLDTRRPSPGPVSNVVVRITGGDGTVIAERQGVPASGAIEWADVTIPNPGTYRVEVDVDRPIKPVSPFVASWSVDPAPIPRVDRVVSTRSWAPFAAIFAAGWVLLVAAGWWGTRRLFTPTRHEANPAHLGR
jgi:methionine-rich copper-binding protein CopC/putative copper export protein